MTSYNSQVGCGKFSIQFETDNRKAYLHVQRVIRQYIDGDNDDGGTTAEDWSGDE